MVTQMAAVNVDTAADLEDAVAYSIAMIERNMDELADFPESCTGPAWKTIERDRDARHWVDGFWTGLLWLAYGHTGDAKFEAAARDWSERLAWLRESTATHDLGFVFSLSHILGARMTGDESLYANALQAAGTLLRRYNECGEYIQAWGKLDGSRMDRGRINIDVMMNLALLYWASEFSGDPRYAQVATQHARTSRLTLMRRDGSIAQVGDFDADTGIWLRRETHQGFSYDSCWSRGQAWAMYGFANAYRSTGVLSLLETARACTSYALANMPDDLTPYWDYDSPDIPDTYRDTSAASTMACALFELAAVEETDEAAALRETSARITQSLWRNYSSRGTNMPTLLLQGARSVPHGLMDHALIYGDYYFFEALTRLTRPDVAARAFPAPRLLGIS